MPEEAARIHGITRRQVPGAASRVFSRHRRPVPGLHRRRPADHPQRAFDMRFLQRASCSRARPELPFDRAVDTLMLAQRKFPGRPPAWTRCAGASAVDNSAACPTARCSTASCWPKSTSTSWAAGRRPGLRDGRAARGAAALLVERPFRPPRPHAATAEELAAHAAFVAKIKDALWTPPDQGGRPAADARSWALIGSCKR